MDIINDDYSGRGRDWEVIMGIIVVVIAGERLTTSRGGRSSAGSAERSSPHPPMTKTASVASRGSPDRMPPFTADRKRPP